MLLMPLLLLAAAAEANVIQDTLENPPKPPWEWVRGERESWRVKDGKLEIRALHGTLWKRERNDAKNLLVRPWPAEAGEKTVISVKVRFAPERGGEQAGVMFYFGDDDYVKIVRESLEDKRWVVMAREVKGDAQPIEKRPEESNDVTLYLTRKGARIEGSYCVEGKTERVVVGACDLPPAPAADASLKLCLFAHGGPSSAADARWATFSDFTVTRLTND